MSRKTIIFFLAASFLLLFAGQAKADVIGIDVSRWQGTIDWETTQKHIDFTIIKAGGSDVGMYTDRQFIRNRDEARRLDIPRGYYYFAGGGDPIREAEHFASITGELLPGEVVALDMEIDTPDPVAYSFLFLNRTEELLGVKPMLYTNMNRVWGSDWRPVAESGYPLWGAIFDHDHKVFPQGGAWPQVTIKQFTSKGTLPGVSSQYVDMNVIRGDSSDFEKLGKAEVKVEPEPQPSPSEPEAAVKPVPQPRVPKPGYMGGLGDGRINSLDSGQQLYFPPVADEPETALEDSRQEQALARESHKGADADADTGVKADGETAAGADQADGETGSDATDSVSHSASQVGGRDRSYMEETPDAGDRQANDLPASGSRKGLGSLFKLFLAGLRDS